MLSLVVAVALAQVPTVEVISDDALPRAPRVLRLNWTVDGAVTGAGLAVWVLSEGPFKHALAPDRCSWCDRDASGRDTLNGVDAWGRGVRWHKDDLLQADALSNAMDFAILPAALLGTHLGIAAGNDNLRHVHEDLLIIAEAVVISSVVNQGTKFLAGRERPFVHVLPLEEKSLTAKPDDNNLSFFSGHTNFAFSMLAATLTVAELRDYRHRWALWAVGVPLAVSVPYFRMAADRHYLTDVTVGAIVGTAFGVGLPLLFHGRVPSNVNVAAGPGGVTLAGTFP